MLFMQDNGKEDVRGKGKSKHKLSQGQKWAEEPAAGVIGNHCQGRDIRKENEGNNNDRIVKEWVFFNKSFTKGK